MYKIVIVRQTISGRNLCECLSVGKHFKEFPLFFLRCLLLFLLGIRIMCGNKSVCIRMLSKQKLIKFIAIRVHTLAQLINGFSHLGFLLNMKNELWRRSFYAASDRSPRVRAPRSKNIHKKDERNASRIKWKGNALNCVDCCVECAR